VHTPFLLEGALLHHNDEENIEGFILVNETKMHKLWAQMGIVI
jgi:hypothetical protein